jgi:pSer/pThr/pTyr-binding forkhead associated (FHA) protein
MNINLPMTRISAAAGGLRLQLEGSPRIWELSQNEASAGRAVECEIALNADAYPMVSRKHLTFYRSPEGWRWRDAGTQNGVYHNGQRRAEAVAQPGDRLQLGPDGPVLVVLPAASLR